MKTKVLIIPIDLGFDISDIINTTITELTSESRSELNKALTIAKAARHVINEKNRLKDEKANKIQIQIETLYKALTDNPSGLTTKEIKTLLNDEDLNMSTFTNKFKQYIKSQNDKLELEKVSRSGISYYRVITL